MHNGKSKWIMVITYQLIPERGVKRPDLSRTKRTQNCILYCMNFEKQ